MGEALRSGRRSRQPRGRTYPRTPASSAARIRAHLVKDGTSAGREERGPALLVKGKPGFVRTAGLSRGRRELDTRKPEGIAVVAAPGAATFLQAELNGSREFRDCGGVGIES